MRLSAVRLIEQAAHASVPPIESTKRGTNVKIDTTELEQFARMLNARQERDRAMERARELYYLGHCERVVKALVLEARLYSQIAVRAARRLQ